MQVRSDLRAKLIPNRRAERNSSIHCELDQGANLTVIALERDERAGIEGYRPSTACARQGGEGRQGDLRDRCLCEVTPSITSARPLAISIAPMSSLLRPRHAREPRSAERGPVHGGDDGCGRSRGHGGRRRARKANVVSGLSVGGSDGKTADAKGASCSQGARSLDGSDRSGTDRSGTRR